MPTLRYDAPGAVTSGDIAVKNTGVSRKIDDLGRLVLPAEIRRRFGLTEGSHVEIQIDGDRIILNKLEDACVFCGAGEQLRQFRDRRVCPACVSQLTGGVPSSSSS